MNAGSCVKATSGAYAITVSLQAYDIAVHERGWDPTVKRCWVDTFADQILA